jgi:hypothetical protein
MEQDILKYLPLDKSWIIRMGFLDLINSYTDIIGFLDSQIDLGDDLLALKRLANSWHSGTAINVGESGTIFRFLQFYLWKNKLDREIIKQGTLKEREIYNISEIVDWPLKKLLTLDDGTSQWASASVLAGNPERIENPPFKLKLTFDAVEHWNQQRKLGKCWLPKYDETIKAQAKAFLGFLKTGKMNFQAKQPEDYCFARIFEVITSAEGECSFPSLKSHESNRIQEAEKAIQQSDDNQIVSSNDHRIVQAIVMRQIAQKKAIKIGNPDCVSKSWPLFWKFIQSCMDSG